MDCKDIQILMTDHLALETTPEQDAQLQTHLAACENCRREFAEMQEIWKLTGEVLKSNNAPGSLPPSAHETIMAAAVAAPPPQVKKPFFELSWTLKLAASILALFAFVGLLLPVFKSAKENARFSAESKINTLNIEIEPIVVADAPHEDALEQVPSGPAPAAPPAPAKKYRARGGDIAMKEIVGKDKAPLADMDVDGADSLGVRIPAPSATIPAPIASKGMAAAAAKPSSEAMKVEAPAKKAELASINEGKTGVYKKGVSGKGAVASDAKAVAANEPLSQSAMPSREAKEGEESDSKKQSPNHDKYGNIFFVDGHVTGYPGSTVAQTKEGGGKAGEVVDAPKAPKAKEMAELGRSGDSEVQWESVRKDNYPAWQAPVANKNIPAPEADPILAQQHTQQISGVAGTQHATISTTKGLDEVKAKVDISDANLRNTMDGFSGANTIAPRQVAKSDEKVGREASSGIAENLEKSKAPADKLTVRKEEKPREAEELNKDTNGVLTLNIASTSGSRYYKVYPDGTAIRDDGKKLSAEEAKKELNAEGFGEKELKELSDRAAEARGKGEKKALELKNVQWNLELTLWDLTTEADAISFLGKRGITLQPGEKITIDKSKKILKFSGTPESIKAVEGVVNELQREEEKLHDLKKGLPFINTKEKPVSTFSIDVDTASYTATRKLLLEGRRPAPNMVRAEEFINYFDYHYRSPEKGMFAVYLDAAPSAFRPQNYVLRVGVQGKELGPDESRPSSFTVLIDTSGSMNKKDRIELAIASTRMLAAKMKPSDTISILACGSETKVLLNRVPVARKNQIELALGKLIAAGATDLEKGMITAYSLAERNYIPGGYNRVIVFSDGIVGLGSKSAEHILAEVDRARSSGITNTIIGVGGDGDETLMEKLADKGDGSYVFLDSMDEAAQLFETQFAARFREIARDVKIQVEFNPSAVNSYRQVGYQNRQLSKADFRNDSVDAGEVGAGQSVTALYELAPGDLRAKDTTIATIRIRYKDAATLEVEEKEFSISASELKKAPEDAGAGFVLAMVSGEFAELLQYPDVPGLGSPEAISRLLRVPLSGSYARDPKSTELERLIASVK